MTYHAKYINETHRLFFNNTAIFPVLNKFVKSFSWGSFSESSIQFSYTLLLHHTNSNSLTQRVYRRFNREITAQQYFNRSWSITSKELSSWISNDKLVSSLSKIELNNESYTISI